MEGAVLFRGCWYLPQWLVQDIIGTVCRPSSMLHRPYVRSV